jgi:fanconi-associated nuclease 1
MMDRFVQRRGVLHDCQNGAAPDREEPTGGKQSPCEPAAKRVKRELADNDGGESETSLSDGRPYRLTPEASILHREETAETLDPRNDDTELHSELETQSGQPTAMESSVPEIFTEKDAVEEYETFRASQGEDSDSLPSRFIKREWVKGKSSLYVDAFNLALGTVLEDESHLFDEKERALFDYWDKLSYEAQYL